MLGGDLLYQQGCLAGCFDKNHQQFTIDKVDDSSKHLIGVSIHEVHVFSIIWKF